MRPLDILALGVTIDGSLRNDKLKKLTIYYMHVKR